MCDLQTRHKRQMDDDSDGADDRQFKDFTKDDIPTSWDQLFPKFKNDEMHDSRTRKPRPDDREPDWKTPYHKLNWDTDFLGDFISYEEQEQLGAEIQDLLNEAIENSIPFNMCPLTHNVLDKVSVLI